jgi:mRNA interferase RelE/StbE
MAAYRVQILGAAVRELAGLDKPIGRRIVERINWLAENYDEISPERLKGLWLDFPSSESAIIV